MRKKINYIIIAFLLLMIPFAYVNADYKCSYNVTFAATSSVTTPEKASPEFLIKSDGTIANTSFIKFNSKTVWIIDEYLYQYIDYDEDDDETHFMTTAEYVKKLNGSCPKDIYMCNMSRPNLNGSGYTDVGLIINAELYSHIQSDISDFFMAYPNYNGDGMQIALIGKKSQCAVGSYNASKSEAGAIDLKIKCNYYQKSLYGSSGLSNLFCDINEEGCTVDRLNTYNQKRDDMVTWCNSLLQYADYIDPCLSACTHLQEDLGLIDGKTNLGECGVPAKILVWANNILKWVKYILPVLVIIFGIIDFIKAMASNNDDEIKKAQKRFTIRLIAAALTFVIPLIITFILNKMGFTAEACGIDVLK